MPVSSTGSYIREGLVLLQSYFKGGLLFEFSGVGLLLERGLLLEHVRYLLTILFGKYWEIFIFVLFLTVSKS